MRLVQPKNLNNGYFHFNHYLTQQNPCPLQGFFYFQHFSNFSVKVIIRK